MNDFYTCQRGGQCTREHMPGSQSAGIVQRLDELMRRCREERHQLTYQDLAAVRYGGDDRQAAREVLHVPV